MAEWAGSALLASGATAPERKHRKLYWIDPGIVRAVKRQLGPVTVEERGALLEGWISTLLRAYGEHRELFDELYYWAPTQARRVEVDFLLRRDRDLIAIEVKSQQRFLGRMAGGLKAIGELDTVVRRLLVYEGASVLMTEDGVEVWPIAKLLEVLATDSLWP